MPGLWALNDVMASRRLPDAVDDGRGSEKEQQHSACPGRISTVKGGSPAVGPVVGVVESLGEDGISPRG